MLDEREHRRGLVLGLTLAEVLLLLLFVLLLALSARFKALQDERDGLAAANVSLTQFGAQIETGSIVKDEGAAAPKKDAKGKDGKDDDGLAADAARPLDIYLEAAKIDPNDPPQVLKLVKELLEVGANPDRLAALSEMAGVKVKLEPGAPSKSVLAQTVGILQQLKTPKGKPTLDAPGSARLMSGASASDSGAGKHNWPPIITLSEADGKFYQSGSAELSPELKETILKKVIPRLLDTVAKYDVNVIEVIGHTDEQPISSRVSDLDKTLASYVRGVSDVRTVLPADNAGLGLARAATVARLLVETGELNNLRILPFSGGQLINVDDTLTGAQAIGAQEQRRRRIEIRVRRTEKPVETPTNAPGLVRREASAPAKVIETKERKDPATPATAAKEPQKGFFEKLLGP